MELKTWLKEKRGRASSLALHLGVSQGRITQMSDEGVPLGYMRAVRKFTNRAVSLESMVATRERRFTNAPNQKTTAQKDE